MKSLQIWKMCSLATCTSHPFRLYFSNPWYATYKISPNMKRNHSFSTAFLLQHFCGTSCFCDILQKSWKRRFFVLSKTSINYYQLRFFKDGNKREKPLGQINLYQYVHNHIINKTLLLLTLHNHIINKT